MTNAYEGNKTNFYALTTETFIEMYLVAQSYVPLSQLQQPLQPLLGCCSYTSVC